MSSPSRHHPAFQQEGPVGRPQTAGQLRSNSDLIPSHQIQQHFSANITQNGINDIVRPNTVGHAIRGEEFQLNERPLANRGVAANTHGETNRPATSPTNKSNRPTTSPTSQQRIELRRELRFANWTVNTPFIPSSFTRDTAVTLSRKGRVSEKREGNTNSNINAGNNDPTKNNPANKTGGSPKLGGLGNSGNSPQTTRHPATHSIHAEERRLLLERPKSQTSVAGTKPALNGENTTNHSEQLTTAGEQEHATLGSPPPHVFGSVPGVISLTGKGS
jgi:hypothetical protein